MIKAPSTKFTKIKHGSFFVLCWALLLACAPHDISALLDYVGFSFLGLTGALFANSTGAGGGVVFIPMFNQLNFTDAQAIATSFAIQCFGMTAGAVTWWHHYKVEKTELRLWQGFKRIIAVVSIAAVVGLSSVFYFSLPSPSSLHYSFSWFSLLLGLFIVATIYLIKPRKEQSQLQVFDYVFMIAIGLFGGAITAWLSVGVGEVLAIYLILRRFDISMAVASAVVVSAISVWAAIGQVHHDVYWQVVLFAGPGALLGGYFAKTLVGYLSAVKLKLFFAAWLLISGTVSLL
ncbi:sulfite exporter TauE/SafE family protein [Colwellia sp. D2M02]|uniref:sulfite exporter TauE/SafE family protein n=1 Tax=Colwellia sp. D2M02 TaxID=2841562 RepID=UPI001C0A2570|nr:sulfite exporter TauE/SafE family protein [Colwellia sp. D2M02]MBU2894264.1 sulfite exporter TauE/SafE family protein [Colwellia sp. D2M02]